MADTLSIEERSKRMSRIRGIDTRPELMVRRYLHARGFRFRLHGRGLPGKPDIILPKYRTVIFVHGCFWHSHHCQQGRIPGTRSEFWQAKFEANRRRDVRNSRSLRSLGWRVLIVWECSLSTASKRVKALDSLVKRILRP